MVKLDPVVEDQNCSHLVWDIAWFGFASAATGRFLPYFALRLGATPLEVGLITALPAVMLFIVTWFTSGWLRRYDNSRHAMLWPTTMHRMAFLLPIFAPFFAAEWRPLWIIFAVMLPAVGQGIGSTVFIVMMREAVTEARLTPLVTRRKLWMSAAIGAGTLLSGLLLEAGGFPLNYQIVFLVGFSASLISFTHLIRVKVVSKAPPAPVPLVKLVRQQLHSANTRSMAYVILTSYLVYYFVVGVIPVHLKALGASEGFIAIFGVVELLAAAASTVLAVRLVQRFGNRSLVALSVLVTAGAAVILGLATDVRVTLVSAALTGAAWTVGDIAMFGYFAEHADTQNVGATMIYNEVMYVGTFLGPLLGNGLLQLGLNTVAVLWLGAGLRLGGSLLVQLGIGRKQAPGGPDLAMIQ